MILRAALFVLAAAFALPATAQTTSTYSNTSSGTIDGNTRCTTPLVRTFAVSGNSTLAGVDIGILATHSWRGDLQFTLQSPAGTRVQLTNGDTSSISGNNFNVLLDDSATQSVNTDSATGNHSTTAPPYQNTFSPRSPLSSFIGENRAGTWRLEICDLYPSSDNGSFVRADLYLTSQPSDFADLSLSKAIVASDPVNGGTVTYRLTVTNASNSTRTATGVTVAEALSGQLSFSSASGSGSFNSATGIWTVPDLAPGSNAILDITATISAASGTTVTSTAQISTSNFADSDSTPGNGANAEDDYASVAFTVQAGRAAGIPPALVCPNGSSLFDWDAGAIGWVAGSISNSFALGSFGSIAFSLTNNGAYIDNATFGGLSPTLQTTFTGGISPAERSLGVVANQTSQSGVVTITITLPRAFKGVQFSIFDVDFAANQFTDRVVVTGTNGGASVTPTLTNGNTNYVTGNVAIGDGASNSESGRGNLVVTFTDKVDTIVITYGNHTTAPADPGQQGIAIHDIEFCLPFTTLGVTKLSSVISDPVNGSTNPKAIPGALIEYLISVTNTGAEPTDTDTVVVTDDAPADAKMCLADLGGTGNGPVLFGAGSATSGLGYSFAALGNGTDDLEFSADDGVSWTYVPTPDADGCDGGISNFRVRPTGALPAAAGFTLRVRFKVE